jgi:hypothetical protein
MRKMLVDAKKLATLSAGGVINKQRSAAIYVSKDINIVHISSNLLQHSTRSPSSLASSCSIKSQSWGALKIVEHWSTPADVCCVPSHV